MKHIPNLITSLNLTSGFLAIIFASQGDLLTASFLIAAAMVFDFFDGFSARLLKSHSDIGKELDSLADVVSFGVAPSIIIFRLLHAALLPGSGNILDTGNTVNALILIITALMPVCAALRLAIFNLDSSQSTTFKGLPTPANAITVISIVIASRYSDSQILQFFNSSPLLIVVFTIALSLLMVSRIPLLSLKLKHFGFRGNEGIYILAGLVIISIPILGIMTLPLFIPLYIVSSVTGNLIK